MEFAPLRQIRRVRHQTRNRRKPRHLFVQLWNGRKQALGVGMRRIVKYLLQISHFDNLPGIHDADCIARFHNDPQIMGNQEHCRVKFLFQPIDHLKDLRLNRYIQRRGGLIGNQKLWIAGQCNGNHHPLLHAAREADGDNLPRDPQECPPSPASAPPAPVPRLCYNPGEGE